MRFIVLPPFSKLDLPQRCHGEGTFVLSLPEEVFVRMRRYAFPFFPLTLSLSHKGEREPQNNLFIQMQSAIRRIGITP
jgi:hypothetical protein